MSAPEQATVACGNCGRVFRRASERRGGHLPPHKCPHGKRCSQWRASECSICDSVAEGRHAARGACIFCDHPEGYDAWIEARKAKGLRVPDCYMPPPRPCRHRSEVEAAQLAEEVARGVSDVFAPAR